MIAEVDETLTIDAADAEKKVTPRTKAIIPVDMNGLNCEMRAVMGMARRKKLLVVEDACQACGGKFGAKRLGAIGAAGGFSFNFFKIISCGEGGAVTLKDRAAYERANMFADGGCSFRPHAKEYKQPFFAGNNFRLNEILGAMMNAQLKRLDGLIRNMNRNKKTLLSALDGHPVCPPAPVNDLDGDCGTTAMFQLCDAETAERFVVELKAEGFGSGRPINSGRHVYCNWEPIMQKKGGHVPARDPYASGPGKSVKYSKDMCPRTLDILARTVSMGVSPNAKREDMLKLAKAIEKAVGRLRAVAAK